MSSNSRINLPCKVPMECFTYQPSILRLSNHIRNLNSQTLIRGLRFQNTKRFSNMVICKSNGVGPGSVIPSSPTPTPGPGSWKAWFVGILMTIILPMWRGNWRPLLKIKHEVETVIDVAEAVADTIEKVAEELEKVVDEIGDLLPEGKLKDALEVFEDLADETADGARIAGDFIDKVEDMVDQVEEKAESMMKSKGGDEEKKEKEKEKEKGDA